MIFVSVGTPDRPFNRLIEGVDLIADRFDEKIVVQIGHSTYIPQNIEHFRFCNSSEMLSYIKTSRIVIAQAGFGIIGNSIRLNKPLILVPREQKYGEAVDKQYELAEYLASRNESIVCIRDVAQLYGEIEKLMNSRVHYDFSTKIPAMINEFISKEFSADR